MIPIKLREDSRYEIGRVAAEIKSRCGSGEETYYYGQISEFFRRLHDEVLSLVKKLYGGYLDISIPTIQDSYLYTGGVVGVFRLDLPGCSVDIEIEPKVGKEAYLKMLSEALAVPTIFTRKGGYVKPSLVLLPYFNLYNPISFSVILLELTEAVMGSPPPRKVEARDIVSQAPLGKPNWSKSLPYLLSGNPFAVFKRFMVTANIYPYKLLANFHREISLELKAHLRADPNNDFYSQLIDNLARIHEEWYNAISALWGNSFFDNISIDELIVQTRNSTQNPVFQALADLYEVFVSRAPLMHSISLGSWPSISSRVYELWILRRLLVDLTKEIEFTVVDNLAFRLNVGNVSIYYNTSLHDGLLKPLLGYGPRPDFVIYTGGGVIIVDAKYKKELEAEDVERLLLYILDRSEISKVTKAALFKLCAEKCRGCRSYEIRSLRVRLYICDVDPRMSDKEINDILEKTLEKDQ